MTTYGVMFRREYRPELLAGFARDVEAAGFDELWVVEDLGYHGGFSQATIALAATATITVGLGIAPAVARNAAFAAMEAATIARVFPGRFHMGIGHGVASWVAQVGATPSSWLRSIAEVTVAVKRLVAGDTVTIDGSHVNLQGVVLTHPAAAHRPLVSLGVRQQKSIDVAGQVADGVILAEYSGPRYIAATRAALGPDARITVFVNATTDAVAAGADVESRIAEGLGGQLAPYAAEPSTDLFGELCISGPVGSWPSQCSRFAAAGADSIVFVPLGHEPPTVLSDFAAALQRIRQTISPVDTA
jgi:5,10-methylenetetrahydromethanopterin reductase